jgi:hypothetical protein
MNKINLQRYRIASELLRKEKGRQPTVDDIIDYLNGVGLLVVNKIIEGELIASTRDNEET